MRLLIFIGLLALVMVSMIIGSDMTEQFYTLFGMTVSYFFGSAARHKQSLKD